MGGAFFSSTTRVRSARGCSSPAPWRLRFCSSRGGLIATCTRYTSSEVIPGFEDTHATAAARGGTYTPTGSMPVLLPEEVKGNRSTRVVNRGE